MSTDRKTYGMLWCVDDKKATLQTQIEKALSYYKGKYNQIPSTIVIPQKREPEIKALTGFDDKTIIAKRDMPKLHMWIGPIIKIDEKGDED